MELRHLRYFIRAAELLHFTRAAESLYVSQPTLSVHIQQLEEELGVELFARVGRHVRLTEAGELLLARARHAVDELEAAGEELSALAGLLRGTLYVSTLPAHGAKLLPALISSFSAKHPDVRIKARSGSSEDIEEGLVAGVIDIGISVLPVGRDEINTIELSTDDILLVVSKRHALAKKKEIALSDLQSLPIALPSNRIFWIQELENYFSEQGVHPKIIVEHDDGNALIEIVKLGDLATCLPQVAVLEDPNICYWPLPAPGVRTTTAALWTHLSPAAQAFLDVVKHDANSRRKSTVK